ncbi:hypothetical protein [Streptomyces luteireticuli]|uniref:hypothetical protein n=1 Tax=Streptomyces luteireticuli TaxID=173858 RepID=UPI0031D5AB6F
MQPPSIPLCAWWIFSAGVTLVFWACFVPVTPKGRLRIQISLMPVLMAGLFTLNSVAKGANSEVSLTFYSSVILLFVLGFLGRRRELRVKFHDLAAHGERPENRLSAGAWVQFAVSAVVLCPLTVWIISGAS